MTNTASEYLGDGANHNPPAPQATASPENEQGVLGCLLLAPEASLPSVLERFGSDEVFYDLRHAEIYHAITYLHSKQKPIDTLTVSDELRTRDRLDQVGGLAYLNEVQDKVPSAANLPAYLAIVWDKFIARQLVEKNLAQIQIVRQFAGVSEGTVARIDEEHARWKKLMERGAVTPKNLCAPGDFGDAYFDVWFKREQETFGWELPFGFPMRIRPSELTLFAGDNGSGKSSMLGMISIAAAKQFEPGQKVVIASMEVPPEITLWIMARQLLGVGKLECTEENIVKISKALAWLNQRVLLYNFLGITDWRELLNTFRYARKERGGVIFIVDSVMRIGIPDDDYAQQGVVAAQFADFCVKDGAHTFLVVHENKGEGRQKDKVRGSKQWTDNAHNVCAVKRNEAKAEKLEEMKAENKAGELSDQLYRDKLEGMRKLWDTKFILSKQRWPGSQQNASRWLYFDHDSLQFHEQPGVGSLNFML